MTYTSMFLLAAAFGIGVFSLGAGGAAAFALAEEDNRGKSLGQLVLGIVLVAVAITLAYFAGKP